MAGKEPALHLTDIVIIESLRAYDILTVTKDADDPVNVALYDADPERGKEAYNNMPWTGQTIHAKKSHLGTLDHIGAQYVEMQLQSPHVAEAVQRILTSYLSPNTCNYRPLQEGYYECLANVSRSKVMDALNEFGTVVGKE